MGRWDIDETREHIRRLFGEMRRPTLYIFSGLPSSGKSTLAQELAKVTGAVYLRIDTVEQGLRDLCKFKVEGEGYRLSYRIAQDNLNLGISVIADSCNPVELTRREWNDVAIKSNANFINIEVVCSNTSEHQERVKNRKSNVDGLKLPTWKDIENREYRPWDTDRIRIDTSGKSTDESVKDLFAALRIGNIT
jgi:predicted kinase